MRSIRSSSPIFDLERRQYVTLQSKPMTLEVTPDVRGGGGDAVVMQGRGMSKEEVKMLGQDIRFIKLGAPQLRATGAPFLFGAAYWGVLCAVLALFAAIYVALRRQIRESQNAALVRGKRANKVAVQRFRAARRYMEEQNRHAFYEEMLRALWGYIERQVQHSGGQPHEGERPRGAAQAGRVGRGFAALHGHHHPVRRGAVFARGVGAAWATSISEGVDLISRIEAVIKR